MSGHRFLIAACLLGLSTGAMTKDVIKERQDHAAWVVAEKEKIRQALAHKVDCKNTFYPQGMQTLSVIPEPLCVGGSLSSGKPAAAASARFALRDRQGQIIDHLDVGTGQWQLAPQCEPLTGHDYAVSPADIQVAIEGHSPDRKKQYRGDRLYPDGKLTLCQDFNPCQARREERAAQVKDLSMALHLRQEKVKRGVPFEVDMTVSSSVDHNFIQTETCGGPLVGLSHPHAHFNQRVQGCRSNVPDMEPLDKARPWHHTFSMVFDTDTPKGRQSWHARFTGDALSQCDMTFTLESPDVSLMVE